ACSSKGPRNTPSHSLTASPTPFLQSGSGCFCKALPSAYLRPAAGGRLPNATPGDHDALLLLRSSVWTAPISTRLGVAVLSATSLQVIEAARASSAVREALSAPLPNVRQPMPANSATTSARELIT